MLSINYRVTKKRIHLCTHVAIKNKRKDAHKIADAKALMAVELFKRMKPGVEYVVGFRVTSAFNPTHQCNITSVNAWATQVEVIL